MDHVCRDVTMDSEISKTFAALRSKVDANTQRQTAAIANTLDAIIATRASTPFSTRKAPVNGERSGNGMYLVQNYGAGAIPIAHNLGRVPAIWFACGAAVGSQVPKITVTAVSNNSITIQTDVPSNGVIVFIE